MACQALPITLAIAPLCLFILLFLSDVFIRPRLGTLAKLHTHGARIGRIGIVGILIESTASAHGARNLNLRNCRHSETLQNLIDDSN